MRKVILCLAGLLCAAFVAAEDKKDAVKKPIGTWTREADGQTLTFTFRDNDLTVTVKSGNETHIEAELAYGVTKDNLLFGVMTKVTKKNENEGPAKGDLFSFTISLKDKELTLSDLKGTQVNDNARKVVEGVYTKK